MVVFAELQLLTASLPTEEISLSGTRLDLFIHFGGVLLAFLGDEYLGNEVITAFCCFGQCKC